MEKHTLAADLRAAQIRLGHVPTAMIRDLSNDEIVARGRDIYEKQLKSKLESQNLGKYLVIDIETGEYELDEDDLKAALRAYQKNPAGARFEMQIGYATSGTIGNALLGTRL